MGTYGNTCFFIYFLILHLIASKIPLLH